MTAKHRRFADVAGYTRHCWECRHAKGWKDSGTIDGKCATCELTGRTVTKFNSPNNPCSNLPCGCDYETGGAAMTATEELRRMLDERGVDYRFNDATKVFEWHFDGTDGEGSAHATEVDGCINIIACSLTPAQAIAATLGAGTCKVDVLNTGDCAGYECSEYIMHCKACGHEFGYVLYNEDGDVWMSEPPNYCPNCGRKVADDG